MKVVEEEKILVNASDTTKKVLLLVDDEPDICTVLKIFLESNGYMVSVFTDPVQALCNFAPGVYDLAILDVFMPKINGIDLYARLMDIDPKLKVIFLSATTLSALYDKFRLSYPFLNQMHFLNKPVNLYKLKERLEHILAKY